uniref:Ead/Ea22-like family protein n=1 Tax=Citrobacter freundii TaxID=546 RepID=A0AAN4EXM1_CITFR|nr:ead/Ea22-like family protein [Citrobacter freundii]
MWQAWQAAESASEQKLEETRRELRSADATIHNLELKITDMAVQLANAESKCRELAAAENNLIDSECHVAELEESLRDKQALLEALDNALCELLPGTQYMVPPDGGSVTPLEQVRRMVADYRERIAELEAREIKPAKGEVLVVVSGFTGCGKSAIAGEIEIAMKAIGVPVQWTNGDAEKRMTGADWLTAIEMYKPTVRIVEVNVPRSSGIGVKGE